jgi:hypothetical protein
MAVRIQRDATPVEVVTAEEDGWVVRWLQAWAMRVADPPLPAHSLPAVGGLAPAVARRRVEAAIEALGESEAAGRFLAARVVDRDRRVARLR